MAPDVPPLRLLRGDEAELFRTHEVALRAAVRHQVNTSDAVIEDACSFAWLQLMRRQPNRDTVFAWLRTVAIREAWRLHAQAVRELPSDLIYADRYAPSEQLLTITDARRLLDAIGVLSPRQRLVLLLFVSGHSYNEIAADHDLSATAVNKALVRARRHLRAVHDPS
jgi:RNA polymerase sigma factor (sigma-70 family)